MAPRKMIFLVYAIHKRFWNRLPSRPSTPTSDQNRISPYDVNTISSRQVEENKRKYQFRLKSRHDVSIFIEQFLQTIQLCHYNCKHDAFLIRITFSQLRLELLLRTFRFFFFNNICCFNSDKIKKLRANPASRKFVFFVIRWAILARHRAVINNR